MMIRARPYLSLKFLPLSVLSAFRLYLLVKVYTRILASDDLESPFCSYWFFFLDTLTTTTGYSTRSTTALQPLTAGYGFCCGRNKHQRMAWRLEPGRERSSVGLLAKSECSMAAGVGFVLLALFLVGVSFFLFFLLSFYVWKQTLGLGWHTCTKTLFAKPIYTDTYVQMDEFQKRENQTRTVFVPLLWLVHLGFEG